MSTRSTVASGTIVSPLRPRTGSRYAKAVFQRTPSTTFIGSDPQPISPSRSPRSSVCGIPAANRRFKKPALKWLDLVGREVPHPQSLDRSGEQGPQLLTGPSRAARCRPGIVVASPSGELTAAVVGRAASDHPGSFEGQLLARCTTPPVSPVVGVWKRARVNKLRGPAADIVATVVRASLNQDYAQTGLDKPSRHNRAGRPAANDDCVAGARSSDRSATHCPKLSCSPHMHLDPVISGRADRSRAAAAAQAGAAPYSNVRHQRGSPACSPPDRLGNLPRKNAA